MENIWKHNDFFNTYINDSDYEDEDEKYDRTNEIGIHDGGSSYFIFNHELKENDILQVKFKIYGYNYKFIKEDGISFGCGFIDDNIIFDDYENDNKELKLSNSLYFHSNTIDVCNLLHSLRFGHNNNNIYRRIDEIGDGNYTKIYNENCELTKIKNSEKDTININYDTICTLLIDMNKKIAELDFGNNIIYRFNLINNEKYFWFYLCSLKDYWACFKIIDYKFISKTTGA